MSTKYSNAQLDGEQPASIEGPRIDPTTITASPVEATLPPTDPFDPARLRLSQDFAAAGATAPLLVRIGVGKPSKQRFIRVHPDPQYRIEAAILELKEDSEWYLVDPSLWLHLADEPLVSRRMLFTSITAQGTLFLWPVRLPDECGRLDSWNTSALRAAQEAETKWIRLTSNREAGDYNVTVATVSIAEPQWPTQSFAELLAIAFRGKLIETLDHPVLRQLRGEV